MLFSKCKYIGTLFILISTNCFALSLSDLTNFTIKSNSEIQVAQKTYESQILSSKDFNGSFSPSLSFNSSVTIPKGFEMKNEPNFFDTNIHYLQPLPGGTSVSVEFDYNFNARVTEGNRYISRSPNISFRLSQSLLPYWIQGQINEPIKLSFQQKKEYYYYQLLYTKKNILLQLFQNYIYTLISLNEIEIWENSIDYYNEQIESLKKLIENGRESQSKIIEVENSKWSAQQNLISAQVNYSKYIQNLKTICGQDFDENTLDLFVIQNYDEYILNILDNVLDPLEKIYALKIQMLESSRVLEVQSSAPQIEIVFKPIWAFDITKQNISQATPGIKSNYLNWTLSTGLDLSSFIRGLTNQNEKKYQLEYLKAQDSYNSYLTQKDFVKQQYKSLLKNYTEQQETIAKLNDFGIKELKDYESLYEIGSISKLDLDSVQVRVENYGYTKTCIDLYILLYNILIRVL